MEVQAPCGGGSAGESRWSLGSSLAVRNVQDLVSSCAADELTADLLNAETVEAETAKLKLACEEWGFFQVLNHGVPDEVIVGIKQNIHKFFELPLDVKNAYAQRPGDLQGYGQAFVFSDDQKLDWADMFGLFTQPTQARDMSYWPSEPRTFRNSIEEYTSELMKLSHSIVTFIAKTLDFDPELMADKNVGQFLRMNYYPPCMSTPGKVLGFSPHSDASFITILLEVNSVQGLQIRRRGAWIPVKPHGDALLVNVGDFLEIMTNGKYKSIEHRVTINAHKERLSISAFHVPKYDGIVSPVLGNTEEKVLYKTTIVEEYARLYLSSKRDGKRTLDHAMLS
ncbi:2-oxoglutarate-dependent dioxygenase 11-like [Lolium rigidum]|uniref:2-oxoglutarate-dependent dioxygenase 11-like n=1 Tax=Lolium rigidum TaxID=89674 RepID=UPI001F5DFF84|nr:2-oxoglutarate-dependent dioxygenase 11-like [Lolium rigidum]